MKTRLAICLVLAATSSAVAPSPASAQAPLPPHEIITSVRSMGLEPISRPVQRGGRYVLRAIDRRGAEVTVAADALTGRVLAVRPRGYGERPIEGPVYADRAYPRYPQEMPPPRGGYQRQGNYEPPDNYQQPGNYVRPPARIPGEPSVIYAPRDNANPQSANPPPPHAPSAAKPAPTPKVAAKPPAASAPAAAPVEAPKTEASKTVEPAAKTGQPAEMTTGTATSSPPAPVAEKPPESKAAEKPLESKAVEKPPEKAVEKPPESKVAAKPPAQSAPAPAAAAKNPPPSAAKTGGPSWPPLAEKNPALTAPPVQAFD